DGSGSSDTICVVVAYGVTVIVAVAMPPPSPPLSAAVDAWTSNEALPAKPSAGVNRSPKPPSATAMKSPALIGVAPSFWNSVPCWMFVILKCVTSPLSAALGVITRPLVVWTCAGVVAFVTDGGSATALTVIEAATMSPPRPALALVVDAWTSKLAVPKKFGLGVNLRPAAAGRDVMKSPLLIGVVPLFWYSVPFVMFVTLTCVTSAPSAGFFGTTRPLVVCVSSFVVAFAIDGVSATGFTVTVKVRVVVST